MLPAIPRACPVIVVEGIPGAGKTRLERALRQHVRDRPLHQYCERALLFHWSHAWIPGIHGLRLELMQRTLDHVAATLATQPDALFVLTRFHLSYALLGGDPDTPAYALVVARLAALGAQAWVPVVPDHAIAARASHPERDDPAWQAHLQRRLRQTGSVDVGDMYARYQRDALALLARQPVVHALLSPQ